MKTLIKNARIYDGSGSDAFKGSVLIEDEKIAAVIPDVPVIGGIFADQAQKETRIIVTRTGKATARRVRSIEAYKEGKQLGFESFEQYSKMSVNTMAPVSRPVKDEVPVNSARKPTVRKKESPVTATVDTTRVQSTPTSSVTSAQKKKKEQEGESIVYI